VSNGRLEAVAICTPGLEPVCEAELNSLGIKARAVGAGVVQFKPSTRQLYVANLWLRTASRVLVRIARFRATDFNFLVTRAREVNWGEWLGEGVRPEFRVTAHKSKLMHTEAINERLMKVALLDRSVDPTAPAQPFVVRVENDLFTISVDTSGTSLHQRAWRTDIGVAPLRPTMASALLLTAGWNGSTPVCDPFCGSGTIAIEAALIARNLPPGGDRDFAFAHWPHFEPGTWASVAGSVGPGLIEDPGFMIEAYDRDGSAVERTKANAERAGVADIVRIEEQVVSHLGGDAGTGLIVTNPPYGKRIGGGDLAPLYKRFGAMLRERRSDWELAVVAADSKLARSIDGRLKPAGAYGHGGQRVQMFTRSGKAPDAQSDSQTPDDPPPTATT
jgi:putative N6-adenine-specific DNA methylase